MNNKTAFEKVIDRVKNLIDNDSLYEAQQQVKTLYHRYKSRKMFKECYNILEEVTLTMFNKKQFIEGFELAKLLLQTLCEFKEEDPKESFKRIEKIISNMPKASDHPELTASSPEIMEGYMFIKDSIKKSNNMLFCDENKKLLFSYAALYLWDWHGYHGLGQITICHTKSQNWTEMSKILRLCIADSNAKKHEEDLFICRAVLQIILYTESLQQAPISANAFLLAYEKIAPLPKSPFINFCQLIIKALEKSSKKLFLMLHKKYKPILMSPDAHLNHLCEKIINAYFNNNGHGSATLNIPSLLRNVVNSLQGNSSNNTSSAPTNSNT